ncbi:flagellar hook-basal body complex protein FliE [Swingsia samuiensis]|uniref:Flagellar hook-basal body complex protein FliE n=1 Tax=Swingsia samuiensis TaxID=1293412 RepID=A0A4Y6UG72_9PROT|nr:flagellar hook-basal body complex protein FliE [Swingsia samuiensis]QDH16572.1 flagellar hook-basal body complex protein FliE [Swingsia samuiensis]
MMNSITQAHDAYRLSLQNSLIDNGSNNSPEATTPQESFGAVLSKTLQNTLDTGHDAEQKAVVGLNGHGDMTQIVTAVSNAQLALQTTTTIRDRMVQSYQDIMRMSI